MERVILGNVESGSVKDKELVDWLGFGVDQLRRLLDGAAGTIFADYKYEPSEEDWVSVGESMDSLAIVFSRREMLRGKMERMRASAASVDWPDAVRDGVLLLAGYMLAVNLLAKEGEYGASSNEIGVFSQRVRRRQLVLTHEIGHWAGAVVTGLCEEDPVEGADMLGSLMMGCGCAGLLPVFGAFVAGGVAVEMGLDEIGGSVECLRYVGIGLSTMTLLGMIKLLLSGEERRVRGLGRERRRGK